MNGQPKPPVPGFNMEVPADLVVLYSNIARISHTPLDFVLDFSQALPGEPHSTVLSRIVMSPAGAKLFMRAINENLARYEAAFGEIPLPKGDAGLANDLFRRVSPPDISSGEPPTDPPPMKE